LIHSAVFAQRVQVKMCDRLTDSRIIDAAKTTVVKTNAL